MNHKSGKGSKQKKTILTFTAQYLPGYKGGGPIRSIANIVDHLNPLFNFKIITMDRDLGDEKPYDNIKINAWNKIGKAEVFYLAPNKTTFRYLKYMLSSINYDVLYLNSFFNPVFTIKPLILRRLKLIPNKPVVLAPRGEFSQGALNIKSLKKDNYIRLAKLLGLYSGIHWQASSEYEHNDIKKAMGVKDKDITIAPNLPPAVHEKNFPKKNKVLGKLDIIFLSRIDRKKNLDGALKILSSIEIEGEIIFDIYGPITNQPYWDECKALMHYLPSNIKAEYKGVVPNEQVRKLFSQYDLFFFPTHGENFGHVILESLLAGTPVLISDQTPWRNLAKYNAGLDISLNETHPFLEAIESALVMTEQQFKEYNNGSKDFAKNNIYSKDVIDSNIILFKKLFK
jgi:glycosyltransferase involved in cell wall biosynthesis